MKILLISTVFSVRKQEAHLQISKKIISREKSTILVLFVYLSGTKSAIPLSHQNNNIKKNIMRRNATAVWNGTIKEGKGHLTTSYL
jgi:hypothetical protein